MKLGRADIRGGGECNVTASHKHVWVIALRSMWYHVTHSLANSLTAPSQSLILFHMHVFVVAYFLTSSLDVVVSWGYTPTLIVSPIPRL